LGGHLGISVKDQLADFSDREGLFLPVAPDDDQGLPCPADAGAVVGHVNDLPVGIRWKQTNGVPTWVTRQSLLLGQAHRGQRATETKALIVGHRRALHRPAQLSGTSHGLSDIFPGRFIHGNPDGCVVRVIANPGLLDRGAGVLLQQQSIGTRLEPVAWPGPWPVLPFSSPTSLMLVRNQPTVPPPEAIHLPL
jgi:hypothetical protein